MKSSARVHQLFDKLLLSKKQRSLLQKKYNNQAEIKLAFPSKSKNNNHFYSTYGHFDHPSELAKALSFNTDRIAVDSIAGKEEGRISPLYPAYYGMVCYNHYVKTGDNESLNSFWKQVQYLENFGNWESNSFKLIYNFNYEKFGLKAPWISGITQALAASLFYRANLLDKNKNWEKLFCGCIQPMFEPIEEGGLLIKTAIDTPWIEEYPSASPSFVFNGFIFCIIASIEYANFTQLSSDAEKANQLIQSLIKNLHKYTYAPYIRHNLKNWDFSNIEYQGLNIFQFVHLYEITQHQLFKELAIQYNSYINWSSFFDFYALERKRINIDTYFKQ